MHCPSCEFENPEGMKFCGQCASPLSLRCPQCGFVNPPGFTFCGQCASPLSSTPGSATKQKQTRSKAPKPAATTEKPGKARPPQVRRRPHPSPTRAEVSLAERRQLTVLFCDLVDSTALAAQLDPEEWRTLVQAYHHACAEGIQRYAGHIAQYLGDGLLLYFGYPIAHEDDALRAVRTGLGIIESLQHLSRQVQPPLQVRIGIHTGLVVVGEIGEGKREQLALGEVPNVAARLQGLAQPGTVVISAPTYRLIAGLFNCQDLGLQTIKGIATPVQVYRVQDESGVRSRLEVATTTGLTPLVGREQESGLLWQRWGQAKAGAGQVVWLSGEPGIGKSRLVQVLKENTGAEGATRIEFRCSPYYQNSALYPVIDHLQRLLQFDREDPPAAKLAKLEQRLKTVQLPLRDVVPLLAALLSLPHPANYPLLTLSPQQQRQKTQEALVHWLRAEAEQTAVCCVWEDLHWADPSTLELLGLLIDQVPTSHLFMLGTFRPEFIPPWPSHSHVTLLMLSRLLHTQAEEMVNQVTRGKTLPTEVLHHIVTKTDGVPLFVEELTKMVLESGFLCEADGRYELTEPLPRLAIPTTLQDSLMARLDRLATGKEVAQRGATFGREFSYELLQAISLNDERSLQQALTTLVEAEVLYQRGLPPQAHYVFKHALIQDAAYQSLLKSTRQQYHRQIARVLEERFPETVKTQPEVLAHHATEAGLIAQAIPYWQRAGQQASERSANAEAIAHLTKGLELLTALPDAPERAQQELTLQVALGPALIAARGYAAPEVGKAYTRARELCQQIGDTAQLFPVLGGLWQFHLVRAEYQTTRALGELVLSLAQNGQDPTFLVEAHDGLGQALLFLGELAQAQAHLEQGLLLYDPQHHRELTLLCGGEDPGVACGVFAALTLWLRGYPDQALTKSYAALALAQELTHPFSLAVALAFTIIVHQFRREEQAVHERAEAMIALSNEQGFALWVAWVTILRGWAIAEQGQGEEGIAQLRQGMTAMRATGAEVFWPYFLALLAEACGKAEQAEEGLAAVAEALEVVYKTGERFYEAELYRLKGELTLQSKEGMKSGVEAEVEACFQKAIAVARHQSAKSLELRAVMSLSRLWQQQGKQQEAHAMLAEIYHWFTEGFDTKDLQEAKTLLEELH
jgi:class 3 adenylate cyclase/predicted ATPase